MHGLTFESVHLKKPGWSIANSEDLLDKNIFLAKTSDFRCFHKLQLSFQTRKYVQDALSVLVVLEIDYSILKWSRYMEAFLHCFAIVFTRNPGVRSSRLRFMHNICQIWCSSTMWIILEDRILMFKIAWRKRKEKEHCLQLETHFTWKFIVSVNGHAILIAKRWSWYVCVFHYKHREQHWIKSIIYCW